jgi:hypothetical protein
MKVTSKENYTILKDTESNIEDFILNIENQYINFQNLNLILDLSHNNNVTISVLNNFKNLVKKHKKNKKSLVIVVENIDFTKVSNQLNIVPTLIEAKDIIELEEIERDLGFRIN